MISTNKTTDSPSPEDPTSQTNASEKSRTASPEEQIRIAARLAQDRKAEAIQVLRLSEVSDFTDYFLICSGTNERQVQSIGEAILKGLRQVGARPLHAEGQNAGRWILLDYGGDLVIHVFLNETRRHYSLERLWGDAPDETERFLREETSAPLDDDPAS